MKNLFSLVIAIFAITITTTFAQTTGTERIYHLRVKPIKSVPNNVVIDFYTAHAVRLCNSPSGYIYNMKAGFAKLLYWEPYSNPKFNFGVTQFGLKYEYDQGSPNIHTGKFQVKSALYDWAPEFEIDLVAASNGFFQETGLHALVQTSSTEVWVIGKRLVPADSTMFPTWPYIVGDDTVNVTTNVRLEYLVKWDLLLDTITAIIPIYEHIDPTNTDWRQYSGSGVISTWLGGHVNAVITFVDATGVITGVPGKRVFGAGMKQQNGILFVDEDNNKIGQTGYDIVFTGDIYNDPALKFNPLHTIHGLSLVQVNPDGSIVVKLINNYTSGTYGEALPYYIQLRQDIVNKRYMRLPAVIQRVDATAPTLGSYQTVNDNVSAINFGSVPSHVHELGIAVDGVEAFTVDIPDYAGLDTLGLDSTFTDNRVQSFAWNVIVNPADNLPLEDKPEVRLDTMAGQAVLMVEPGYATYAFFANKDSMVTTTQNWWPVPIGLPVQEWVAGVEYGEGFLFGSPKLDTGIDEVITAQAISVYPNPTVEKVYFSIDFKGSVQFQLTDMSGKVVTERKRFRGNSINVEHLASGTYILRINDGGKLYVAKVKKE